MGPDLSILRLDDDALIAVRDALAARLAEGLVTDGGEIQALPAWLPPPVVRAQVSPSGSTTAAPSSLTRASRKFIDGEPMKPPTKVVAGLSYNSIGVPSCSMLPPFRTIRRWPRVIASTWSWVT